MHHQRIAIAVALVVFAVPTLGRAEDKPTQTVSLPREFTGTFAWQDVMQSYTLTLKIDKFEEKDGTIRFTGSHEYTPGDFKMKVKGTIDAKSRKIVIRESDPSHEDSDVDGSFEGTISTDLKTIEAVWTSTDSGRKGDLKIQAKKAK